MAKLTVESSLTFHVYLNSFFVYINFLTALVHNERLLCNWCTKISSFVLYEVYSIRKADNILILQQLQY